jgi:hypothetical protein
MNLESWFRSNRETRHTLSKAIMGLFSLGLAFFLLYCMGPK